MAANKIKVAYPILLVLAGLGISFIPGIPQIHIDPELIFIIFLPPLLYDAAWAISWKELWRWRRIVSSFAFIVVFFTALSVAFVANHFIPGFSLALGLLLGGIVSPPDAVSAGAILKFVKIPKRMASILEGESLLNDASSLIIFRFALIAVATGQFVWYEAAYNFVWMVVGGVGIGLTIGFLFMKLHKFLPTDSNMDIVLTFLTPYFMYIAAEELHSSGVLAVVAGGLLLSNKRHLFLSSSSRLRGVNVWESLVFILNGLVFMLIGLDLPEITNGLGNVSVVAATGYGVLITLTLILARMVSAYGAVVVTLIARNFITVADASNPGAKVPFILGWTGMRGVVSLAAALSIPIQMENHAFFPQRNLILYITFVVILLTLLVQGLTLPYLIKRIGIPDNDHSLPEEQEELHLRQELMGYAYSYLNDRYQTDLNHYPFLQQMAKKWKSHSPVSDTPAISEEEKVAYLDILDAQRKWLLEKNRSEGLLNEDLIRKQLTYLDLEEEKMRFI